MSAAPGGPAGVAVARLDGDVDPGAIPGMTARLLDAVPPDGTGLVLDLRTVRYLDSAGVQMLFDVGRALQRSRRGLAVALGPESPLQRLVAITNLTAVAVVRATPEECAEVLAAGAADAY